jgi:hypothetical protein
LVSGDQPPKEPFLLGAQVYAMIDNEVYKRKIIYVSTPLAQRYSIKPQGNLDPVNVPPLNIPSAGDLIRSCDHYVNQSSELSVLPQWIPNISCLIIDVKNAHQQWQLNVHPT